VLAKVIHDNLNAGGGSERLAINIIELLSEMGFDIDVQTCEAPDIEKLENNFGRLNIKIRKLKKLDLLSLLQSKENVGFSSDDRNYNLIINTHGDVLPYVSEINNQSSIPDSVINNNPRIRKTKMVTYCHYPLVPYYVKNGVYGRFLYKLIAGEVKGFDSNNIPIEKLPIEKLLSNASSLYDSMLRNTVVLTNSEFSKRAIKRIYNNEALILSPPVDVNAFRKVALYSNEGQREDKILVVSRFSADKQIENAIEVAKLLHDKKLDAQMIIVGNVSRSDMDYLYLLRRIIDDNDLNTYVRLEVGASFERLLHLMSRSKLYLHPLAGEPFGIAVAEAMAAGLIPVVPHVGGNSEFVPERYHYGTLEEAAEIIRNVLLSCRNDIYTNNIENKMAFTTSHMANNTITEHELRLNISNLVLRFSTDNFKNNLKRAIDILMTEKDRHIPVPRRLLPESSISRKVEYR
jgi:glycosyltransferase involved in cell wall biosynthesis